MNNINQIVNQLEAKISELYRDKTIASGLLDTQTEPDAIDEYTKLQQDSAISNGVRYIALDAVAQQRELYTSTSEKQNLTDIIGQALSDNSMQKTFDDLQSLKLNYAAIYKIDPVAFNRVEKLVRTKLELPPMQEKTDIKNSVVVNESAQTFVSPSPTQYNSSSITEIKPQKNIILATIIGVVIGGGLITLGLALGRSSNEVSQTTKPSPTSNSSTSNTTETASSSTQVNSSSISREAATEVINQWLIYKRVLLAPPYDKQQGSNILYGKAYRNNVDKSSEPCSSGDPDDCLSSADWLKKYNAQYSFGVQRVDSIDKFEVSGDTGTIFVTVTEFRTLHKPGDRSVSSGGTKQARYDLKYDNGKVKIIDYKVF
jgi:hypothetical protein